MAIDLVFGSIKSVIIAHCLVAIPSFVVIVAMGLVVVPVEDVAVAIGAIIVSGELVVSSHCGVAFTGVGDVSWSMEVVGGDRAQH